MYKGQNAGKSSQNSKTKVIQIHESSDRAIKKTAQAIRHVLGRTSVEPGFPDSLTDRNRLLEDNFEIRDLDMRRKPKDNERGKVEVDEEGYMTYKVKGVVTTDFDGLVSKIINMRGYNPHETDVLCGLDDGQKFNKIGFIVKKKKDEVVDG